MRSRLLVTGLLLLGASLLLTLFSVASGTSGGIALAAVLGWCAQASLYVGAGLTIAGGVLHELHQPAPQPAESIDYYGG